MPDPVTADVVSADIQQIRAELKAWEHDFCTANGRKPGRADIKSNRDIAAKYKLYDRYTRPLPARKCDSPTAIPQKRKRDSGISLANASETTTPRKVLRADGTLHPSQTDPYDAPVNWLYSPVPQRTIIGPTPQKNGKVLGLFDLLSPESARNGTPGKGVTRLSTETPSKRHMVPGETPSRTRTAMNPPDATPSRRAAAAPASILTPSRSALNKQSTPSLRRTRTLELDDTPEFLKRHQRRVTPVATQDSVQTTNDEGRILMDIQWSPIAVRQPRKPLGRSFSELAQGLRKMEEDKLDDELDILRNLEQEDTRAPRIPGLRSSPEMANDQITKRPAGTEIPVADSNPTKLADGGEEDLPLGPDGEREVDRSEEDEGEETMRVRGRRWQRKGPKRQTKKFNIAPDRPKWKPEPKWTAGIESDDDENGAADVIPETQVVAQTALEKGGHGLDLEYEEEPNFEDESGKNTSTKDKKKEKHRNATKNEPTKTRPTRKVNPLAHANFRSLKIKNRNSKGNKGRFARGRRPGFR